MRTVVVHHDDPDGWMSAQLVKFADKNAPFIEASNKDYADPTALIAKIKAEAPEELVILDFSIPPELLDGFNNVLWIDHHKTAIAKYKAPESWRTHLDPTLSACEITWKVFSWIGHDYPTVMQLPRMVNLIGIYDTWRKDDPLFESEAVPFIYGLRAYDIRPTVMSTYSLLNLNIDDVIAAGKLYLKCKEADWKETIERTGMQISKFFFINSAERGSRQFGDIIRNYDAVIAWYMDTTGMYQYQVYAESEFDVGAFCFVRGGGGHKGAGGFRSAIAPQSILE